jgi:cytochrome oxidase assembly protein ShyY1
VNNPLIDVIPDRYRKQVYAAAAALVFLLGLWQLAQGDWKVFLLSIVGTLVPATAASNTLPGEPVLPAPHKHRRK